MRFIIISESIGHMLQINKNSKKIGVSTLLTLIMMIFGGQSFAQSKYNFQVTGGYTVSDQQWNMNGYNVDMSLNRKVWDVISFGLYVDYDNVDDLIPQVNGDGSNYRGGDFIPPALDTYIKSLYQWQAMNFSQDMASFLSYGIKTNFDFKISKKLKMGFGLGAGLTTRKWASFFLASFNSDQNGKVVDYNPATIFLKTTEFSWRYEFKFTYDLSKRIDLILLYGHNASHFKKYAVGFTTYEKLNLGIGIKL